MHDHDAAPILAGFYCANTVSLSFGTLAVNDVVAAALTVGFCEVGSAGEARRCTSSILLIQREKSMCVL